MGRCFTPTIIVTGVSYQYYQVTLLSTFPEPYQVSFYFTYQISNTIRGQCDFDKRPRDDNNIDEGRLNFLKIYINLGNQKRDY